MPSRREADRIRRNGFTLVELMVVLTIFGLIVAVAVPGGSRLLRSSRLVGAENTLVGDLRYARSLASTRRTNIQVVFSSSGYMVVQTAPADTIVRRSCPTGVTNSATVNPTFYPWGLTTASTITVTNSGGSKVLTLSANGQVVP
jgi:type IV fimbrial biogenesis protein FimT